LRWEVEEILGKRFNKSKKIYEYNIKWKRNPATGEGYENTWEPAENMTRDIPKLVTKYEKIVSLKDNSRKKSLRKR
jgi:hypothetical protein